jgi:hypothetical protein
MSIVHLDTLGIVQGCKEIAIKIRLIKSIRYLKCDSVKKSFREIKSIYRATVLNQE